MKTVHEIKEEHGRNAAAILTDYQDTTDQIRAEREPEEGAYLDRLTPQQRMGLLREQKAGRADEAHRQTLGAYREEVERYHDELAQRRTHLKGRLFGVEGPDGAAALSRTVLASEGELSAYLDVAIQAGNKDLARAAFVAAERKGLGAILLRYFDEVDNEARALYNEWSELPTEEVLERQRENIERVVQPPDYDRLTAYARATT
jgi:hypothetical protein